MNKLIQLINNNNLIVSLLLTTFLLILACLTNQLIIYCLAIISLAYILPLIVGTNEVEENDDEKK